MLNEAAPNDKVLVLKSFEAFIRAADGKSNKNRSSFKPQYWTSSILTSTMALSTFTF